MKSTHNKNKKDKITLVIHPTPYGDFDVLFIGDEKILRQICHKNRSYHLIKSSKFGGIPLVVMDTCSTLRECLDCIKEYNKLYRLKPISCLV